MTRRTVPDLSPDGPRSALTSDGPPSPPSEAALALALVPGVGPKAWRRIVAEHGDAESALRSEELQPTAARAISVARQLIERCTAGGIRIATPADASYPARLHSLPDPPIPIFGTGAVLECASSPAVAIVGTRRPTSAGRRVARRIAGELASEGITIVSGMAAGIDAEAHAGALDAGGRTLAVLGTGVDVPYPLSNRALHARISMQGAVVSESPPGRRAQPGAFPRRNRIIAALADFTLVIEAGHRSGALITAQVANAIGRPFGALPGPVDAPECAGSNRLLRDGAHVILEGGDVLSVLSLPRNLATSTPETIRPIETSVEFRADTPEFRILEVLAAGPQFADDLVRAASAAARDVNAALSILTLSGLVAVDPSGLVSRR